jgi:2-dehydropantoate 2-reductase
MKRGASSPITDRTIVVYGAGSVGSSLGGWLAPHCPGLSLLSRGEHRTAMKKNGLVVFVKGEANRPDPLPVPVIASLSARPDTEIVILAVKNYGLDAAARDIKRELRGEPLIVALQNGVENQKVLPRYFTRVIYGIVCYNSWREGPGIVGTNLRGPIVLGVPENDPARAGDLRDVRDILRLGCDVTVTERFTDAAITKMVINLTNSVLTLVGHPTRPIRSIRALKRIAFGVILEGQRIARVAGHREAKLPGMPRWREIRLASLLPDSISDRGFQNTLGRVGINSMGQDILVFGRGDTELETLTGWFVKRADELSVPAPYNRTIYDLCRERFGARPFVPMDETEVWQEIQKRLGKGR